jgi:hypothetical protein
MISFIGIVQIEDLASVLMRRKPIMKRDDLAAEIHRRGSSLGVFAHLASKPKSKPVVAMMARDAQGETFDEWCAREGWWDGIPVPPTNRYTMCGATAWPF